MRVCVCGRAGVREREKERERERNREREKQSLCRSYVLRWDYAGVPDRPGCQSIRVSGIS